MVHVGIMNTLDWFENEHIPDTLIGVIVLWSFSIQESVSFSLRKTTIFCVTYSVNISNTNPPGELLSLAKYRKIWRQHIVIGFQPKFSTQHYFEHNVLLHLTVQDGV